MSMCCLLQTSLGTEPAPGHPFNPDNRKGTITIISFTRGKPRHRGTNHHGQGLTASGRAKPPPQAIGPQSLHRATVLRCLVPAMACTGLVVRKFLFTHVARLQEVPSKPLPSHWCCFRPRVCDMLHPVSWFCFGVSLQHTVPHILHLVGDKYMGGLRLL